MLPTLNTGDIVDADLGNPPDQVVGHEQGKLRPCLVIKPFNHLKLAIILPITSKQPKTPIYSVVKLTLGTAGLSSDSYVLCHQIRTISLERVVRTRGKLVGTPMLKVQAVLLDMFSN